MFPNPVSPESTAASVKEVSQRISVSSTDILIRLDSLETRELSEALWLEATAVNANEIITNASKTFLIATTTEIPARVYQQIYTEPNSMQLGEIVFPN
jgi:acetylglutamate synthase